MVVGHIRDRLTRAERRLYLQAWHLRELAPGVKPAATAAASRRRPASAPA